MKKGKYFVLLLALAVCLLLSGCIMKSVSELYELPEQSADAKALQLAINDAMPGGAQLASIAKGSNQQPVQMADFDGDGVDEAIVFVLANGEKPLKVYVFDQQDGAFVNTFVIESGGSAFDSVVYAQMDGTGGVELIIGRQVSNQSQKTISVYSVNQEHLIERLSSSYSDYVVADLDLDEMQDLFLVDFDAKTLSGMCTVYHQKAADIVREPEIPLHFNASGYIRTELGYLEKDLMGVFVNGSIEDNLATAVFTLQEGALSSFTTDGGMGLHATPIQGYNVFPADYDGDGLVEFPSVLQLPVLQNSTEEVFYRAIMWYRYNGALEPELEGTTYHDFSRNWYLRFPKRIGSNFGIARVEEIAGTKGLSFYNNGSFLESEKLFTIFAFTGSSKNIALSEYGCFILSVRSDTVFAAKLGAGAETCNLSQEEVVAMFNDIRVNWMSGSV